MRPRILARLLGPILALSFPALASGQSCPGPDGLDGPCWAPAAASLPDFPPFSLPGLGLCFEACAPSDQRDLGVSLGTPAQTTCGQYQSRLTVRDTAGGATVLVGTLLMDYTRTWQEVAPTALYQVWRFPAKVELAGDFDLTPFCPVPACLGPYRTAFFYGYVDWALDCRTGEWRNALVLFHDCDLFSHHPVLSDKPSFPHPLHPDTSSAIVAPHTAVNPFVPNLMAQPQGQLIGASLRNVGHPAVPGACTTRDPATGQALLLGTLCPCPFAPTPAQFSAATFQGAGTCLDSTGTPSSFVALRLQVPFGWPWVFLHAVSVGRWTSDDGYPGDERVIANQGFFLVRDGCAAAAGQPSLSVDVMYGASTVQGYDPIPIVGPPLTDRFIDLASNYSKTQGIKPPFIGSVLPTKHLISGHFPID